MHPLAWSKMKSRPKTSQLVYEGTNIQIESFDKKVSKYTLGEFVKLPPVVAKYLRLLVL